MLTSLLALTLGLAPARAGDCGPTCDREFVAGKSFDTLKDGSFFGYDLQIKLHADVRKEPKLITLWVTLISR